MKNEKRLEIIKKLKEFNLNDFETLTNGPVEIEKETEKAVGFKDVIVYSSEYEKNIINWIPKSVAKIENNKIIAIKGWFADKQGDCLQLHTNEAVKRFDLRYDLM